MADANTDDDRLVDDAAVRQRRFRNALGRFATGVTVVTTVDAGGADVGVTANSFNSVSLDPPLVLWSIARSSTSIAAFETAEYFAVHVLGASQRALSERFSRKRSDRFAGVPVTRGKGGVPLIEGSAAVFQCRTASRHPGGDHIIIVGEVMEFDERDHAPLIYHAGAYGLVVGGAPGDGDASDVTALLRQAVAVLDAGGVTDNAAVGALDQTEILVLRTALSKIVSLPSGGGPAASEGEQVA